MTKSVHTLMLYRAQLRYCIQFSHLPSDPTFTSRPPNICQSHTVFNAAIAQVEM